MRREEHCEGSPAHEAGLARFITRRDVHVEQYPWGPHDWLARPDLVDTEEILLVRVHMPRGASTPFHRHPALEEVVYVLHGRAEQWVGEERRVLAPGDVAHIPKNTVHATFNAGRGVLRVLSILGPAGAGGEMLVDAEHEEPWRTIRAEHERGGTSRLERVERGDRDKRDDRDDRDDGVVRSKEGSRSRGTPAKRPIESKTTAAKQVIPGRGARRRRSP